jgi:O-antigen ligase
MNYYGRSADRAAPGRTAATTLAVLVAAAFFVIAPLSVATELEAAPRLKIARIVICGLGTVLAVASGALRRAGATSVTVLSLAVLYVVAAAWSPFPLAGVLYKGIFLSAIVFGLALGVSLGDPPTLRRAMRVLGVVAVFASGLVLQQYRANPTEFTRVGRLAYLGMNANAVGMTAAGYLFLAVWLAMTEHGAWRILGTLGAAVLLTVILATGSRAALAMGLLGGIIQLIPWIPHPRRVVPPVAVIAVLLVLWSASVEAVALERFADFEKNTRAGMWQAGVRRFLDAPVLGHGWLTREGRSTSNYQNVYLQVLAETGVVGGLLLLVAGARILGRVMHGTRGLAPAHRTTFYLATGIVAGLALHGIAESNLLHGSNVNTFLFGFGLGLLESVRHAGEHARTAQRASARAVNATALVPVQTATAGRSATT